MIRVAFLLLLLCAGCAVEQPTSARTVAAYEVPLLGPADKAEFLDLLSHEAEVHGYHVDSASEADLARLSEVSPISFSAAVWRGEDQEAIASAMDFREHLGRVWLIFTLGEDPERSRKFREAVLLKIRKRWPETASLPVTPNGGIPLTSDMVRTETGYEVRPDAAHKYQVATAEPAVR